MFLDSDEYLDRLDREHDDHRFRPAPDCRRIVPTPRCARCGDGVRVADRAEVVA